MNESRLSLVWPPKPWSLHTYKRLSVSSNPQPPRPPRRVVRPVASPKNNTITRLSRLAFRFCSCLFKFQKSSGLYPKNVSIQEGGELRLLDCFFDASHRFKTISTGIERTRDWRLTTSALPLERVQYIYCITARISDPYLLRGYARRGWSEVWLTNTCSNARILYIVSIRLVLNFTKSSHRCRDLSHSKKVDSLAQTYQRVLILLEEDFFLCLYYQQWWLGIFETKQVVLCPIQAPYIFKEEEKEKKKNSWRL